jgi:hypothetical protein
LATHLIFLELTHFPHDLQTIICYTKCHPLAVLTSGLKSTSPIFKGWHFFSAWTIPSNFTQSIDSNQSWLLLLCEGGMSFPIEIVRLKQKLVLNFV